MQYSDYDIIIIGGGMVGASLACALRDTPLRIALIDAAPLEITDDHRLIALTDSSYCFLKQLNVWEALAPHAEAIQHIHVSEKGSFGAARLSANDMGLAALGYVVPAKYINAALYQSLHSSPSVTLIRPAKLTHLSQNETEAILTFDTLPETLRANIVIGADGSHSTVRKLLNISTEIIDYQQSALVTTTTLQRSHHNIAYERFHQNGAIAMLPLTAQQCATIWTDRNETIARLMQLSETEFLNHLQKQFGYRLGRLGKISHRYIYPLQRICAKKQIQQRAILIGNAAHTLHPLAAQGFNIALSETAYLAEKLRHCSPSKTPPSLQSMIGELPKQNLALNLSHHLAVLFSKDFFIINKARQLGMIGLDLLPFAKKEFVHRILTPPPTKMRG